MRIIRFSLALALSLLMALPSYAQVVRRSSSTSTNTSSTTSKTTSGTASTSRQEEPKSSSTTQVVRRASDVATAAKTNQQEKTQTRSQTQTQTQSGSQQTSKIIRRTSTPVTSATRPSSTGTTSTGSSTGTTATVTRTTQPASSSVAQSEKSYTAPTTSGTVARRSAGGNVTTPTSNTTATTATSSATQTATRTPYEYSVARGGLTHTTQPAQAARAYNQKVNHEAYGMPKYNVRPAHRGGYVMPIVYTAPIAIPPRHLQSSYCYGKYFTTLPVTPETIMFGGISYYYSQGLYYRYIQKRYVIVRPPVGALLNAAYFNSVQAITFALADALVTSAIANTGKRIVINGVNYGTEVLTYDDVNYFYDDGVFFVVDANGNYVVVEPPVGALVRTLPSDRQTVKYNGISMYKVGDAIFRKVYVGGILHYEVVGTLYVD